MRSSPVVLGGAPERLRAGFAGFAQAVATGRVQRDRPVAPLGQAGRGRPPPRPGLRPEWPASASMAIPSICPRSSGWRSSRPRNLSCPSARPPISTHQVPRDRRGGSPFRAAGVQPGIGRGVGRGAPESASVLLVPDLEGGDPGPGSAGPPARPRRRRSRPPPRGAACRTPGATEAQARGKGAGWPATGTRGRSAARAMSFVVAPVVVVAPCPGRGGLGELPRCRRPTRPRPGILGAACRARSITAGGSWV